jgi:hypothetical protein
LYGNPNKEESGTTVLKSTSLLPTVKLSKNFILFFFLVAMNDFMVGNSVSGDTAPDQVDYYRATLAPKQFLYIQATGPTAGSVAVALKR